MIDNEFSEKISKLRESLENDDDDEGINVFVVANSTNQFEEQEPEAPDTFKSLLHHDDFGLTYAVVYAHLYLIEEADAIPPSNNNWRFSFNNLLPFDALVRFYRTRGTAPAFVRSRIRVVLDHIGWIESSYAQGDFVKNEYVRLEMAARKFISNLHVNELLPSFVLQCQANYRNLAKLTQSLDVPSICKGIEANIFSGVQEVEYSANDDEGTAFSETVCWVPDEVETTARGKENGKYLTKLFEGRFKPRLTVDEEIFSDLEERFPHFIEVTTFYKAQFRLNLLTGRDYIPPVLLLGSPGIGKTRFAKELAHALNTGYTFIDMASASAGFTLSGLSTSWNGAKPGKLVTAMLDSPTASPVVLLDEVEKTGATGQGQDPRTPLYQLLEQNTARAFTDEFVDCPVDLSRIIYVACANSTEGLTEPLLTRFKIMEIPEPSDDEHDKIVDSIYQTEVAGSTAFPATLTTEIKHLLRGTSLREAKVMISNAIAKALLDVSLSQMKDRRKLALELLPGHFKIKTVQKRKIGF